MCSNCGCSNENFVIINNNQINEFNGFTMLHDIEKNHSYRFHHEEKKLEIEQDVLYKNNLVAQKNRGYFEAKNILTLNIVGTPGSGKTSVLEKFVDKYKDTKKIYVIEGDQFSNLDAERIKKFGVSVIQINTGTGCHLNSQMIYDAVKELKPEDNSIIFIENVGNLVCPSLFDLGENYRIMVISITEGDDKPLKYPYMFQSSHLCIINKVDLLPYVDLDISSLRNNINKVNHHLDVIEISCKKEINLDLFFKWLENKFIQ